VLGYLGVGWNIVPWGLAEVVPGCLCVTPRPGWLTQDPCIKTMAEPGAGDVASGGGLGTEEGKGREPGHRPQSLGAHGTPGLSWQERGRRCGQVLLFPGPRTLAALATSPMNLDLAPHSPEIKYCHLASWPLLEP
jgi:hypothetical protein